MKEKGMAFGLMAMAAMLGGDALLPQGSRRRRPTHEETEGDKARREQRYKTLLKHKGLEFTIDGYTVTAINRKNAIKKINKLKGI